MEVTLTHDGLSVEITLEFFFCFKCKYLCLKSQTERKANRPTSSVFSNIH